MIKDGIDNTSVEGAADLPYSIPNQLVDLHTTKNGVPVLWWRSVGHSHTAFVVESFPDELAHAAGQDPYRYRRTLLAKHPRHLRVLDAVAKKAGWGKPLPAGVGRGIAVHESFGSFIAQVAEVSLGPKGQVQVSRVVCAVDCGRIVNPDTIMAQMESAITFGLSAAVYGAITLKNGRVEQGNFNYYVIVATPGHLHDFAAVWEALRSKAGFIGLVGSRRKRQALLQTLTEEGFTAQDQARIVTPVGVEIGAEAPEEIAVSIVGQLIQQRRGHELDRSRNSLGRRGFPAHGELQAAPSP